MKHLKFCVLLCTMIAWHVPQTSASERFLHKLRASAPLKALILTVPLLYYSGRSVAHFVTKRLVAWWILRENEKLLRKNLTSAGMDYRRVDFSESPWREVVEHDTVPKELRVKIDMIMHKPDVIQALMFLHNDTTLLQYWYARFVCKQNGITFIGEQVAANDLLNLACGRPDHSPSQRIFTVKCVPGYIFKMSHNDCYRYDRCNIGRIIFAKYLLKKLHDTCRYAIQITIPRKYLYQVNPVAQQYASITPQALVVAQKMNLSAMRDFSRSLSAHNIGNTLGNAGYIDHLEDNVFEELDQLNAIVIVDTEPFRFSLDQINYQELLRYLHQHNLALGKRTATQSFKNSCKNWRMYNAD